jgi:hypothetical protein
MAIGDGTVERVRQSQQIKRAGRAVRQAKYSLRVVAATLRARPWVQATLVAHEAGAYTRPLLSST